MKLQPHSTGKDVPALLLAVKRCMGDLEKDPRMKQHIEQREGIDTDVKAIVEELEKCGNELGNQFEKAQPTDAAQEPLANLKDAKAEAKARLAAKKKVLATLRTMLRKQEKGDAGLAEDASDHFETTSADASLRKYTYRTTCVFSPARN